MKKSTYTAIALLAAMLTLSSCKSEEKTNPHGTNKAKQSTHKIPERILISAPTTGVELGMGWDSRRGEIVPNHCLDFSPIRASGQEITMDMSEVSDQSELIDNLKVSAAVKVKSMFSEGSHAKAKFAKKSKVTSSSTTLLLKAKVDNGVMFIGPPAHPGNARHAFPDPKDETTILRSILKDTGLSLSMMGKSPAQHKKHSDKSDYTSPEVSFKPYVKEKVRSPGSFREHCGDYFVSAVFSGAELIATINFSASSASETKSIATSVKGSYGMVTAGAKTKNEHKNSKKNTDFNIRFIQIGGGPGMIPMSKEGLQQKLRELAFEANSNPKFHTIELRSYREIPESDGLVFSSSDEDFEVITDYYWMLTSVSRDIDLIRADPNAYFFWGDRKAEDLVEIQDEILDIRKALLEISDAYYNDRLPNQKILDQVNHNWFPSVPGEKFVLDLPALVKKAKDKQTLKEDTCGVDNWFKCIIKDLDASMPSNNPNAIKLLLPLPNKAITAAVSDMVASEGGYKMVMLDWYIRPQSQRMCALDPTDNECMSNQEIEALGKLIPLNKAKK